MKKITAIIAVLFMAAISASCGTAPSDLQEHTTERINDSVESNMAGNSDVESGVIYDQEEPALTAPSDPILSIDSCSEQSEANAETSSPYAPQTETSSRTEVPDAEVPAQTPAPASEPNPVPIEETPTVTQPEPQQTRPTFEAGTVIANAAAQIAGFMTRDNGPSTGMGWFTFSFSVYDSMDKINAKC